MTNCPLCGGNARVDTPEWSGARFLVQCLMCGDYETNNFTIKELEKLRENKSPRIDELKASIESSDTLLHITKSQRLGMIVIESGPPSEMTKFHKKLRRRGTMVTGRIYQEVPSIKQDESDKG
jgi:hypothetical protein